MSNSPIQIVLNTDNFIVAHEKPGGGVHKDFYAQHDMEFIEHKSKIFSQLKSIKDLQKESEFTDLSYAKLILKPNALAKSHRPTTKIFKEDVSPIVGGGDLGEMLVELRPSSIEIIASQIAQAEEKTRWKENKKGELKPNPSRLRSEVGAIKEIKAYTAADKRKFSVTEGVAWLSDPRTGGAYIVELFETPPPKHEWDNLSKEKYKLFKSFVDGLHSFGDGIIVSRLVDSNQKSVMLGVKLEESFSPASVQLMPKQSSVKKRINEIKISKDLNKHSKLLEFLDTHPLVKIIGLPPIISQSQTSSNVKLGESYDVPKALVGNEYPIVGIVDGGVSSIFSGWIKEQWGLLSSEDKDEAHGSFIAGLVISSQTLNGEAVFKEIDGCSIVDIDILPKAEHFANYYTKPLEFFQELETAIRDIKARTGARVFNFSLNIEEHVTSDGYSPAAKLLDRIAEENDVIFVISAGNTGQNDFRKEWPIDDSEALEILAAARNDIIKKPAESCRNFSVSALNPPDIKDIVPYALSNYSCRGPGIRVGLKPELAHIGGAGTKSKEKGHGLFSTDQNGNLVDGCGTSYAAPHVAKTLASIDHSIEGDVSRETLMALSVHHAYLPEIMTSKNFKNIVKHLVGFGIPKSSDEILEGSEHAITLVFANRVLRGRKLSFDFTWPTSLVRDGKCYGHAKITLVTTPPFDYRFGSEFVRVNVNAYLRQQQKSGGYKGRLDPIYLPEKSGSKLYEKELIDHAFKWSPIKVYEKEFNGVGPTTNWRLEVESLVRSGEELPENGVPFTALLTITDPDNKEPIFNDMRQTLNSIGVQTVDIKTAARVVSRV